MKSKFKKVISTCLAAVMLLSTAVIAPLTATAAQTQAVITGETSGDFEYELLDDGTAEITGYTGSAAEVTIPSELDGKKVTSIGYVAFENCTSLTSITIPNSVTSIGELAFYDCTSLTSITIPNSVTSIGYFAFCDCTSLASITIPNSVTSIGEYAFSGCTSLTSITIPDSVTEIGYGTFENCTSLASITIPDSVTEIGSGAFFNTAWYDNQPDGVVYVGKVLYKYKGEMPQNTTITVKDGTKGIGDYAFSGCTNLTSITIPDSVTSIGDWTFENCTSLANIYVDSKNESYTEIDGVLFDKEVKTLVCCPAGKNSSSYSIPDSVTSIGYGAFWGCTSLASITIPDSVTEIGYAAFRHCTSLTSITIPASVKYIDDNAFGYYYDDEYNEVKIDGFKITGYSGSAAETYANDNGFEFISLGDLPVEFCLEYELTDNGEIVITGYTGSATEFTIPSELDGKKVTSIGYGAFWGCTSLTSITIPNSVTSIGFQAFCDCTSLASITIPNSVTEIDYYAFSGCTSLTSITIPDSVTEIGSGAFENTAWYDNQPDGVVYVGKVLYKYKGEMPQNTTITVKDGTKGIGDYAFCDCTSLASITIPNSVTSIGEYAFNCCTNLTSITIPDSVTNIGGGAFENTAWYDNQPDGVVYVGKVLYKYKGEMPQNTTITVKDGTKGIGDYAFSGCTNLTSITIPDSVTSIGDWTFENCTSLASITIPNSVTSIGFQAFSDCTSLTSITIPASVKYIDNYAFGYYYDDEYNEVKIDGFKITGYSGSAAETYANDNGFEFISLGEAPTKEPEVLGDVNGDGVISIADATTLQKHLANIVDFDDEQLAVADTNGDGSVSIADATQIQKYLAQLIPSLG